MKASLQKLEEKAASLETRRRRLIFRSSHRGIKEMDIILGDYVATHIKNMAAHELDALEHLLTFEDNDLFAWMIESAPVPKVIDTALFQAILRHRSQSFM